MTEQFLILLFDILLYIGTFVFLILRIKKLNVGMFILMLMTISHMGMIPYFVIIKDLGFYENITLTPFIFLYIMIMIGLYPFIFMKDIKKIRLCGHKDFLYMFSVIIIIISIEPLIENVILLFTSSHTYAEIYDEKRESGLTIYTSLGKTMMNIVRYVNIISTSLFFYYLSNLKKYRFIVIGLGICQVNYFFSGINTASRGSLISQFTMCILCFFFFKGIYNDRILKIIKRASIAISIPFILYVFFISLSRYDSKTSAKDFNGFLLLYLSEGPINFNTQMWEGNHNTKGDVNLCFLKDLLGYDTYITYESRDNHYLRVNGRRIEKFYTYIGDFVSDFDILGAFFVCMFLFVLTVKLLKRDNIPIYNLFILLLIAHMYSIGFTANLYRSYGFQKSIFIILIIYMFLLLNSKSLQKEKRKELIREQ